MPLADELTAAEIAAITPPEDVTPTEWCARHVRLPAGAKDQTTPFDPDRTPYVREILDSIADPAVEVVAWVAPTQVGKTTVQLCFAARCSAQRPGNILWVMPTEDAGRDLLDERIKPMIEATPALRSQMTGRKSDWSKDSVSLHANSIFVGYANSPTALASRPLPYIMADEVAKWPLYSRDEGDPVDLAMERTRWFPYRAIMLVSTPKYEYDIIWREWLNGDRRRYHVPCPRCGAFQVLEFDRERVRLKPGHEEERDRAKIIQGSLAEYHCAQCDGVILDEEKPDMLRRGVWCPEECKVTDEGLIEGELPPGMYRSYHLNCLYSPMLTWSRVLAKFFECRDDVPKLQNFTNSWLALPWQERETSTSPEMLLELEADYQEGTVPDGVQVLVAGVDVQHARCFYVVRGWGADDESWLVEAGAIEGTPGVSDLEALGEYMAGATWSAPDGRTFAVALALVDSGDGARTYEVYDLARRFPQVIRPAKGQARLANSPVQTNMVEKIDGRRQFAGAVRLSHVNTDYYKTKLAGLIRSPNRGSGQWHIPRDAGDGYRRSLTSEHKVISRDSKGRTTSKWQVKPGYRDANHWWDCEVYAQAAAFLKTLNRLPKDPGEATERWKKNRERSRERSRPRRRSRNGGWMRG